METTYTSKDIQRLAGVTRIQIVRWSELGIILPLEDHRGRGKTRIYSRQNLVEAMICRELNRFRVETFTMLGILHYLRGKTLYRLDNESEVYSFWEMCKLNPEAEKGFLMVSFDDQITYPPSCTFSLGAKKMIYSQLERSKAAIVINLKQLIDEAKRA